MEQWGRQVGRNVHKPSFDEARSSSLPQLALEPDPQAPVQATMDLARLEVLFDTNWFGPCSLLSSAWSRALAEPGGGDGLVSSGATPRSNTALAPSPPAATPTPSASGLSFLAFLNPHVRASDPLQQPLLSNKVAVGPTVLYGAAAAPTPEPAFPPVTSALKEGSPLKAMPVPRRNAIAGVEAGDDNNLPVGLPVDPAPALPADVPIQPSDGVTGSSATGDGGGDAGLMELGPQLGTWANRQYRLLEPVPERTWEGGPGSGSGNSAPSSSSNPRSPLNGVAGSCLPGSCGATGPVAVAPGSGGSGSGHCSGQGSGQGSGSSTAAQANCAGPTLLEILSLQHQQQQQQLAQLGQGVSQDFKPGDLEGRAHGDALLLGALHREQAQQAQDPVAVAAVAAASSTARRDAQDAAVTEAAWRWRFTRRWQAEQSRTGPERAGSVSTGDQLEEALTYLVATGATTTTTVSLQIANTNTTGRGGRQTSGSGGGMGACGTMSRDGSMVMGQMGSLVGTLGGGPSTLGGSDWPLGASGSGSFTSGPRILGRQPSGEMLAASREVASLNRRAAVVLQQQMDCEQQADRRVQESLSQGSPWVGQHIPVVQIDEWGSFRFLMLKLRDQSVGRSMMGGERQRILIRGHNYGSEGQLMEECNREILGLSQKHGVPFEAPTVMGGGVMEWRRDRDRHLHLHSGCVMDRALPSGPMGFGPAGGGGGRPASAMDLLNLAAALARQTFPPTYKITVLT